MWYIELNLLFADNQLLGIRMSQYYSIVEFNCIDIGQHRTDCQIGGNGVLLVVEVRGASTVEQSVKCVRDGGMISLLVVGFFTESTKTDVILSLLLG